MALTLTSLGGRGVNLRPICWALGTRQETGDMCPAPVEWTEAKEVEVRATVSPGDPSVTPHTAEERRRRSNQATFRRSYLRLQDGQGRGWVRI